LLFRRQAFELINDFYCAHFTKLYVDGASSKLSLKPPAA
jgi:hypothetical protein